MSRRPTNTWAQDNAGRVHTPSRTKKSPRPKRPRRAGRASGAGVIFANLFGRVRWRMLGAGLGAIAVVALIAGGVYGLTRLGGGDGGGGEGGQGQAVAAPASDRPLTGVDAVRACEPLDADIVQSNGVGDRMSAQGLIIAYEHAFFVERDPVAMAQMTTPGRAVAGEEALAAGLEQIPVGTPWCVTIKSSDQPSIYQVSIRYVDGDDVVQWKQRMTVIKRNADIADSWTITAVIDDSE